MKTAEQIFVILRWDGFQDFDDPTEYITGTKGYRSADEADAECARLNDLTGDQLVRYFVRLVRLR